MSSFVSTWVGAEVLGSTILANVVTGAIIGGGVSAITGGDILDGVVMGGIGGGIGGAISSALSGEIAAGGMLSNPATAEVVSNMAREGFSASEIAANLQAGGMSAQQAMTAGQIATEAGATIGDISAALGGGASGLSSSFVDATSGLMKNAAGQILSKENANLLSGGLNALGGYLAGNAAKDAATTAALAQVDAARIAADAAKFKPIGITTRFGRSNFQKDAQGNVIGAGYQLTPEMKAQQDALMTMSNLGLAQYAAAPNMFAPMGQAGQRAMGLGNQYLAADPQAQAQKYMNDQQALLATGRNRDMSQMLTGEFNRGTYGLATGATGQMGAANPRLEAMLNAQRQQDLGLAAQATQGGMDYAKFGAGMVGTGGDLNRGMFSGQTAAYQPYQTALQGAQYIEGLGQQPLTMGIDIGKQTSNAASGGLLAQGMNNAAQTMQPANAYSPWGTAMMNAGSSVANYQNQQQQQQQQAQQQAFQNAIIAKQFGMVSGGI
jgi:hypothetical protein